MSPRIFDLRALDMAAAYDWTQCGPVGHGDVILARDGLAVMVQAWPVMVSGTSDVFHRLADGVTWSEYLGAELPDDKAERLAAGVVQARRPLVDLVAGPHLVPDAAAALATAGAAA